MRRQRDSGGLIEWTTISYQTLKFWGMLMLLMAAAVGAFYAFRYYAETTDQSTQQVASRESRPAKFVQIEGEVRVKQVNQADWVSARKIKALNVGDVISTQPGGSCKIIYFDGTVAQISEDTIYVVSESYLNPATEAHTIKGEITTGEVHVNTPDRKSKDTSVKLATEEAEAALAANTEATGRRNQGGGQSQFFVWHGKADVLSKKDKKTVTLNASQQLAVSKAAGAEPVRRVPPPPDIIQPQDMEPVLVDKLPTQVELRWKPVQGIKQYRLRVSENPSLSPAFCNQVIRSASFRLANLAAGSYYWQIYSIEENGVESAPRSSKFFVSSLRTKRYGAPIRLDIEKVVSIGEIFELIGKTDPGVKLTVNGRNVDLQPNGGFKVFTEPVGKATALELVARDIAGNITSKTLPIK